MWAGFAIELGGGPNRGGKGLTPGHVLVVPLRLATGYAEPIGLP
jgi:hypothetical protein